MRNPLLRLRLQPVAKLGQNAALQPYGCVYDADISGTPMILPLLIVIFTEFTLIAVLFWMRRFHLNRGPHAP